MSGHHRDRFAMRRIRRDLTQSHLLGQLCHLSKADLCRGGEERKGRDGLGHLTSARLGLHLAGGLEEGTETSQAPSWCNSSRGALSANPSYRFQRMESL